MSFNKNVYDRKWVNEKRKKMRNKYRDSKSCVKCGSTENLQIHHRDTHKKEYHNIWHWSESRIIKEMEKCDILCSSCHEKEHLYSECQMRNSKLNAEKVIEIRKKLSNNKSPYVIAKEYGVGATTIYSIKNGISWKNVYG